MSEVRYFHGSMERLEPGLVMRGRGSAYVADWGDTDFYAILEARRPIGALSQCDVVFAVTDPDDIDLAGGGTEWIFELEPMGAVSRHDLNWSSEISMLVSDGYAVNSPAVLAAADNYWAGVPHPNESVWEYMMPTARILAVFPYESFDPGEHHPAQAAQER